MDNSELIDNTPLPASSYLPSWSWYGDASDKDSAYQHDEVKAGLMSFLVILVSEVGDKTFLISAVMAMRNPRLIIFGAAISALAVMTVLSAFLGHVVPNLISKRYTQLMAAGLFLVFGLKMLKEAHGMTGTEGQDELEEVTQELMEGDEKKAEDMERGAERPSTPSPTGGMGVLKRVGDGWMNLLQYLFSPIFVQTFVLTFLAEWGDRSQIASEFFNMPPSFVSGATAP
ncbi:hypothetical protein HK102_003946 [Quaeritorhiza haematococci]|nr:hypothetical protein HK102_003946 [Quaeritorhiza haematococci]